VTGLTLGLNPVALDVGYAPPSVTVSGTLLNGSSNPLGKTTILVGSYSGTNQLAIATFDVTPDAGGGYSTGRILLPLGAERVVAYAWVGINSSDHVSAELASLSGGSNALRLDVVYDPPTLEVSGTFLDGAGAPLAPQQYIQATFYDGTTSIGSDTKIVDPAAITGAYATTFTMPTHTTRAVVVAYVGSLNVDRITSEVAIVPGVNTLALSAVYDPPLVDISGHVTSSGAPITTSFGVTVEAKDADGVSLRTEYLGASPNASGEYSGIALTLPNLATSVTITLRIGNTSADWVTRTVPVAPGANPITVDGSINVTTLNVSGLVTRDGVGVTDPVTVYVRSYSDPNTLIGVSTQHVTAGPDDRYTMPPIVVPSNTTLVRIQADVSNFSDDDINMEFPGIVVGSNDLPFDIEDTTTWLRLSGDLQRGTDPFTEPFELRVIHTVPQGKSSDLRYYNVTPDSGGHYELFVQVPDAATGATLRYSSLPSGTDPAFVDDFVTVLTDFDPGTENERTYDLTWTPRMLSVSGQVLVDGVPPEEYPTLDIEWLDADGAGVGYGYSATLDELDSETGEYAATDRPPEGATQAVVTIEIGPVYDWFTQTIDLEEIGFTDATVDALYHPVVYTAHGRVRQLGVPADLVRVELFALDAADTLILKLEDEIVVDDPEGDFTISLQPVPRLATRLVACVNYRLEGQTETEGGCSGIDGPFADDIDDQVYVDTQALRLTGHLIDQHGDPISTPDVMAIFAGEFDADGNSVGGFGQLVQAKDFAPDGSLDMLLRPNINATTLRFSFGAADSDHGGAELVVALSGTSTVYDIGNYTYLPSPP